MKLRNSWTLSQRLVIFFLNLGLRNGVGVEAGRERANDFLGLVPVPVRPVQEYAKIFNRNDDNKRGGRDRSRSLMNGARSIGAAMLDQADGAEKKPDPISDFLGAGDMANPMIQLRKLFQGQPPQKPDCIRSYFMGPYSKPVTFSANGSISSRADRTCKWNFIGTEPCIPLLSCSEFNLQAEKEGKCAEFLEVFDGNMGISKFCGKNGPSGVSAHGGLRDLYLRYKASGTSEAGTTKFTCSVSCSKRGEGKPLEKGFEPKFNSACKCGKRPNQDKIVGGDNARKHEFPWMASIVRASTRQPFCGASILNDRMVVTAGHCFKGEFLQVANMEILLGGHVMDVTPNYAAYAGDKPAPMRYNPITLSELDSGNGSVRHTIDEVIIHPLYVTETNDFDVAVIKLSSPIDFQKFPQLNPICLPKLGSYLRSFANRTATVAGWGLGGADHAGTNSILQKLNVSIYSPAECKKTYAHRVNRRMLCAGYPMGEKDSCMGDSGGPLFLEDRPQVWYQVGTVSWGEGCAQSKSPGAYIRTTEVGQWLHYHSNLNEANWCTVPESKKN